MAEPTRNPRGDAVLKQFARQIARLQRDIRNLEAANQISTASIEGGSLEVYDDDDVLRERIGRQKDGSYGRLTLEGPVPPVPSEPDVVVIDNGVVAITWDGRCEEKWPFAEFRNVRVHMDDTVDFTPTRDNQVGSIHAHRGGTIVAVTESDDDNPVYVRLVAVSTAGHTSDPSPAVLVDELDEDDLEDEVEELEWEDGDSYVLTAGDITAESVTMPLSHDPEVESLTAVLAGAPQRASNFTVDHDAQTLTLPLSGWEKAGDVLWVHYPYLKAVTVPSDLNWGAAGWRYLQVAQLDSTDRSATDFNDAGWELGPAPFGTRPAGGGWLAVGTSGVWPTQTTLWIRHGYFATPGETLTVSVRIDNIADIYWNGTLVGTVGAEGSPSTAGSVSVPTGLVKETNVLAIRAQDDVGAGSPDYSYIDVQVTRG